MGNKTSRVWNSNCILVRKEVGGKFCCMLLCINCGQNASKSKANADGSKFGLLLVFPKAEKIYGGKGLFNGGGDVTSGINAEKLFEWGGVGGVGDRRDKSCGSGNIGNVGKGATSFATFGFAEIRANI